MILNLATPRPEELGFLTKFRRFSDSFLSKNMLSFVTAMKF